MITGISQSVPTPSSPTRETASSPSPVSVTQAVNGQGQDAASAATVSVQAGAAGSEKDLAAAVERLNAKIQNLNRNLEFSIDKDNGEVLVRVVDAQTHKVVRQIPSEEALALAHNIDKYMEEHHIGLMQAKA